DARIAARQFLDQPPGVVPASVIDEYDLAGCGDSLTGRQLIEQASEAARRLRQHFRFVEARHHDSEAREYGSTHLRRRRPLRATLRTHSLLNRGAVHTVEVDGGRHVHSGSSLWA